MITQEGERLLLEGPVTVGTVAALLAQSRTRLVPGLAVLDFQSVTGVDSAAVTFALGCLHEAHRSKLALMLADLP